VFNGAPEEDCTKATNAFKEYLEWAAQTDVKIIAQEMHLVSEEYRFGGTPDAIGLIGNSLCLLDWKTSNAVYPDFEARKFGDLSEAWEIFKHYRAAYDLDKQLKARVK
jgi:hypothetical protein